MKFKENLKRIRKEKKLTQKQLAELLNKQEITVRKYESGEISPPLKVIEEIAKILDVSNDELLTEKTDRESLKEWQEKISVKSNIQIKLCEYMESLGYSTLFTEEANGDIGYMLITDRNTFYKLPYDELDDFIKNITKYISFSLSDYEVDKDEWDLHI